MRRGSLAAPPAEPATVAAHAPACSSRSRESTAPARPPRRGCSREALGDDAARGARAGRHAGRRAGARPAQGRRRRARAREAEALLFAAARAELVERGDPARARGRAAWSSPTASSTPRSPTRARARGLGVDEVERDQPLRDRRADARPDLPARDRPGARPPRAPARPTASRTRALALQQRGARGLRASWPPPTPGAGGAIDADRAARRGARRRARRGRGRAQRGAARERPRWPAPRTTRTRGWCWPPRSRRAPSHAYLFHGPAGTGKRTAARAFAAELLAEGEPRPGRVRLRVLHGTHPDLTWVRPDAART